jgi:hypothetical protein
MQVNYLRLYLALRHYGLLDHGHLRIRREFDPSSAGYYLELFAISVAPSTSQLKPSFS